MKIKTIEQPLKLLMTRRKKLIIDLYKEGWSCLEISRMINYDRVAVWRIVNSKK